MKRTLIAEDKYCRYFRLDNLAEEDVAQFPQHERNIIHAHPHKWVKEICPKTGEEISHSVRPYEQGYGCDGTTSQNINWIAYVLCQRLQIDYIDLYRQTYLRDQTKKGEMSTDEFEAWITAEHTRNETVVPDNINIYHVIGDLMDINYKELAARLQDEIESRFCVKIVRHPKDRKGRYVNPLFEKDLAEKK